MAWTEQIGERSWRVRYVGVTGRVGSIGGFTSKLAAEDYASVMEREQRRGVWVDPMRARMTLAEWVTVWFDSLDLDERTRDNYASQWRRHILPRWGDTRLCDISTLPVTTWITELHHSGYAHATVAGIAKLLSMLLTDAVDDGIIPFNPVCRRRHRGRRHHPPVRERKWTTPEKVLWIAKQAESLGDPIAALMIITAAWTGCRWGELAGLHRTRVHPDDRCWSSTARSAPYTRAATAAGWDHPRRRLPRERSPCRRSWSPCCAPTCSATPTNSCSPPPAAPGCGAAHSTGASCARPSTAISMPPNLQCTHTPSFRD
jgi:hypothetical protein